MDSWVRTDESFFRPAEPLTCPLLGGHIPVVIYTDRDDIQADQLDALARFLAIPGEARNLLFGPLFEDYEAVRSAIGEGPEISGPDAVWTHVIWNTVLVPQQGPTGDRFVFVIGDPEWEDEHGVELLFRNERLSHVGRAQGAFIGRFWEWLGER